MHSCKSDISLRLELVYYHSTASWYQHTSGILLNSSKRFETEKIQTLTLVHCSTNESGWDSLLAWPMLPAETPCLLGQCFRLRLLAWFGSCRVPRSAALLPGTAATLVPSTSVALFCWLTWVAQPTALLLGPMQSTKIKCWKKGTNELRLVTWCPW